jgi:diacylglycerol kinase (ATP)
MSAGKKFSLRNRIRSFGYAFRGLGILFFHQHNAWIHLVAAAVAVFLGFFLKITVTEWLFVVAAIGFVLSAEAFNTAIEQLVDRVSPEKNPEAGRIKDIGAEAVLLAAATALVIGLVIFLPKIF